MVNCFSVLKRKRRKSSEVFRVGGRYRSGDKWPRPCHVSPDACYKTHNAALLDPLVCMPKTTLAYIASPVVVWIISFLIFALLECEYTVFPGLTCSEHTL
jgi:hypothetical protein